MHRIELKIEQARANAEELEDMLSEFSKGELDVKDQLLIQYYVLQQVGYVDRAALRRSFFRTDNANPPLCDLWVWVLSWFVVSCTLLFTLFFAGAFAASSSSVTFKSFLITFLLGVVEDMLVFEVCRVYLNITVPLALLKPHLRKIYHVLCNVVTTTNIDLTMRAEAQIVQHFSPACRVARNPLCSSLSSAAFLKNLSDEDDAKCHRKQHVRGTLAFFLLLMPLLYSMMGDMGGDEMFNFVLQLILTFFLLLNEMLMEFSKNLLITIYTLLGIFLLFYGYIYLPVSRKIKLENSHGNCDSSGFVVFGMALRSGEEFIKRSELSYYEFQARYWVDYFKRTVRTYIELKENTEYRTQALIWRNMNRPYHAQARVLEKSEVGHYQNLLDMATISHDEMDLPDHINESRVTAPAYSGSMNYVFELGGKSMSPMSPKSPSSSGRLGEKSPSNVLG